MKLTGKVAIVTGSGRGIGQRIATVFASEGAFVVVNDISIDQARQVVDEIKNQGGTAIAVKADVAKKADVQELVKSTLENFKAIHILVNNAAIRGRELSLLEMAEEDWDAVQDVDLKGVFLCTQAVLRHMMEQRYGKIINISSMVGLRFNQVGHTSYGPAKAGVMSLTKITAGTAGPYGINANAIAPGPIFADPTYIRRTKEQYAKLHAEQKERACIGRVGTPQDIANLALFLASDDSSFITGQVIFCDGGRAIKV